MLCFLSMRIPFFKMQGLGNDFLVFDAPAGTANFQFDTTIRALSHRQTGVGFDQALMLAPPRNGAARVFYRVFNSDGTEVQQCGNGARCIAALMFARQPQLGRELAIENAAGMVRAVVRENGLVSVDMGTPDFDPRSLPLDEPLERLSYSLEVDGAPVEYGAVSMGNPHAVVSVDDVKTAPVGRFGPTIEKHPRFPQRVNVGFMQIMDRRCIRLRVHERGAGETLACGTGACAAVAVGRKRGLLDSEVQVELPGGTAIVSFAGPGQHSWLTGPAVTVFTGSVDI